MKINLKNRCIALLAFVCISIASVQAQVPANTGFVDVNKVLQSMPGYADSIKQLDQIRMMYQNQYNFLLVDLQQKIKQYQIQKDSLSPFVANIKLQEINNAQKNLDTFQAVANNALALQQDQVLSGFLKQVNAAAGAIGTAKKYIAIWDAAMLKNAIWTDPKADITQDVIAYLKGQSANPPAKPGKK